MCCSDPGEHSGSGFFTHHGGSRFPAAWWRCFRLAAPSSSASVSVRPCCWRPTRAAVVIERGYLSIPPLVLVPWLLFLSAPIHRLLWHRFVGTRSRQGACNAWGRIVASPALVSSGLRNL